MSSLSFSLALFFFSSHSHSSSFYSLSLCSRCLLTFSACYISSLALMLFLHLSPLYLSHISLFVTLHPFSVCRSTALPALTCSVAITSSISLLLSFLSLSMTDGGAVCYSEHSVTNGILSWAPSSDTSTRPSLRQGH